MPCIIVQLLLNLYSHTKYIVRWSNYDSPSFYVTKGVHQGSILSLCFFNVSMDELSEVLSCSNIGCNLNSAMVKRMLYANDTVILAPSPRGMQSLLDIFF